jgi:hypothetical protein
MELAEASCLLDLSEHRLDDLLPQAVPGPPSGPLELAPHRLGARPAGPAFVVGSVLGPTWGDVAGHIAIRDRLKVGLRAVASIGGSLLRSKIGKVIPSRLSKEEAWFWLHFLDLPTQMSDDLGECLRAAHAAGIPDDTHVRAWAQDVARRSQSPFYEVPQALRPFFTPTEIAELILEKVESGARSLASYVHDGSPWPAMGFAAFVAPQMSEQERVEFRSAMDRRYDAEPDRSAPRAQLRLALLSTVGGGSRLAGYMAGQPDKTWANWGWFYRPTGYLEMLAGLDDEAAFVCEARRLSCFPRAPSDVRLWLAATEWRELDMVRDAIIGAGSKDEATAGARSRPGGGARSGAADAGGAEERGYHRMGTAVRQVQAGHRA